MWTRICACLSLEGGNGRMRWPCAAGLPRRRERAPPHPGPPQPCRAQLPGLVGRIMEAPGGCGRCKRLRLKRGRRGDWTPLGHPPGWRRLHESEHYTPRNALSAATQRPLVAEPSAPANTPFQNLGQRPLLAGAPRGAVRGSWFPEQLRLPTCQSLGGATGCAPPRSQHACTHMHTLTHMRAHTHSHPPSSSAEGVAHTGSGKVLKR